jgi:hypothetical protein
MFMPSAAERDSPALPVVNQTTFMAAITAALEGVVRRAVHPTVHRSRSSHLRHRAAARSDRHRLCERLTDGRQRRSGGVAAIRPAF